MWPFGIIVFSVVYCLTWMVLLRNPSAYAEQNKDELEVEDSFFVRRQIRAGVVKTENKLELKTIKRLAVKGPYLRVSLGRIHDQKYNIQMFARKDLQEFVREANLKVASGA